MLKLSSVPSFLLMSLFGLVKLLRNVNLRCTEHKNINGRKEKGTKRGMKHTVATVLRILTMYLPPHLSICPLIVNKLFM
jgi:hypothetical protein